MISFLKRNFPFFFIIATSVQIKIIFDIFFSLTEVKSSLVFLIFASLLLVISIFHLTTYIYFLSCEKDFGAADNVRVENILDVGNSVSIEKAKESALGCYLTLFFAVTMILAIYSGLGL